jgi:hypothetical protein
MLRCLQYSHSALRFTRHYKQTICFFKNSFSLTRKKSNRIFKLSTRYLTTATARSTKLQEFREKLKNSSTLSEFMDDGGEMFFLYFLSINNLFTFFFAGLNEITLQSSIPYFNLEPNTGQDRSVYIESYGCQMNINDTEIVYGIMQKEGYHKADNIETVHTLLYSKNLLFYNCFVLTSACLSRQTLYY